MPARRTRAGSAGTTCIPMKPLITRIRCTGPATTRTGTAAARSATAPTWRRTTTPTHGLSTPPTRKSMSVARPVTARARSTCNWPGRSSSKMRPTGVSPPRWPSGASGPLPQMYPSPGAASPWIPAPRWTAVAAATRVAAPWASTTTAPTCWPPTAWHCPRPRCTTPMARSWTRSMSTAPSCRARCTRPAWSAATATSPTAWPCGHRTTASVHSATSRRNTMSRPITIIRRTRAALSAPTATCRKPPTWEWIRAATTACGFPAPT